MNIKSINQYGQRSHSKGSKDHVIVQPYWMLSFELCCLDFIPHLQRNVSQYLVSKSLCQGFTNGGDADWYAGGLELHHKCVSGLWKRR